MKMSFVQYKIKRLDDTETYQVCWLDRNLPVGSKVTLRGQNKWYQIVDKYGKIDASELELNRNVVWYSISKYKEDLSGIVNPRHHDNSGSFW